jgi:hypothetical protein
MPVLPSAGLMLEQAFPNLLMAGSSLAVLLLGTFTPLGLPVWAAGLFIPTVILTLIANTAAHLPWRRASLVNITTIAMVFPVLVIRQSVVRVPFVDGGNGTMLAPTLATAAVILILVLLAATCAVLSQEDPEYAGILFMPAALMVPLLAGQSDLVSLSSALKLAVAIFAVSAVVTVVATFLPGRVAAFVVPAAIGVEFILLTVFRTTSIFPTGAGTTAKVLFATVVVTTVGLAILVPIVSAWVRQVTRIAKTQEMNRFAS